MSFSIRLTEQEQELAASYARLHSMSLGEAFKRALFEKIEEEFDIAVYDEAYKNYKNNPVTYSHEQVKEMLDL